MPSPFRTLEILFCSIAAFLPFILLAVYPFRNHLRMGMSWVAVLTTVVCVIRLWCDLNVCLGWSSSQVLPYVYAFGAFLVFCLAVVKAEIFKTLFIAANTLGLFILTAAISKWLEMRFFPELAAEMFRWTYLLVSAFIESVVLTAWLLVLIKWICPALWGNKKAPWHFLCISPAVMVVTISVWILINPPAPLVTALICVGFGAVTGGIYWFFLVKNAHLLPKQEPIPVTPAAKAPVVAPVTPEPMPAPQPAPVKSLPASVQVSPPASAESAAPAAQEDITASAPLQELQNFFLQSRMDESMLVHGELLHQIDTMCNHLENKDYEALHMHVSLLKEYFSRYKLVSCGDNKLLQPLLAYYKQLSGYYNIKMVIDLKLPAELPWKESDLTVLFGNLLDNAVDSCKQQTQNRGKILVSGGMKDSKLVLTVKNTYEHTLKTDEQGRYLSKKYDAPGRSLALCQHIAESCGGSLEISAKNGIFKVTVTLA